jgi:hypothetical protein
MAEMCEQAALDVGDDLLAGVRDHHKRVAAAHDARIDPIVGAHGVVEAVIAVPLLESCMKAGA